MTDGRSCTEPSGERKVTGVLVLSALACIVTGVVALTSPTALANRVGYTFTEPAGKTEFTTFYGGFYLGIGLFLLVAVQRPALRAGAVAFLALSATVAIPVRVYGILSAETAETVAYGLLLGEILFAGAGWLGWHWLSGRP